MYTEKDARCKSQQQGALSGWSNFLLGDGEFNMEHWNWTRNVNFITYKNCLQTHLHTYKHLSAFILLISHTDGAQDFCQTVYKIFTEFTERFDS